MYRFHREQVVWWPGALYQGCLVQVCSAYCDVTIKLSSAGMSLPNEAHSGITLYVLMACRGACIFE